MASSAPSSPSVRVQPGEEPAVKNGFDLGQVVEDQRREIQQLKERLTQLTAAASSSESASSAPPSSQVEYVPKCPTTVDDHMMGLAFPALMRGLTTKRDVHIVASYCRTLVGSIPALWHPLVETFFEELVSARSRLPASVLALEHSLSPNWARRPWYLAYVQYTGVESSDEDALGDFDSLRRMLPHIRHKLGFRNLCLLPHYESPLADGGYDVSGYRVREALGGEEAFLRFMEEARALDMQVATDAVFNHTSTEHEWFQRAVEGDEHYLSYYVQRNGREKVGEFDRDGDIVCEYRDPDGTRTERVAIFPDIDRTHGLWVEINGKTYQFYRSFLPHQVDLNVRNVHVVRELLRVVADGFAQGVLGRRMDAVAHWVKRPGMGAEGGAEGHAVLKLFKAFVKHVHARSVLLAEVVRDAGGAGQYAGEWTVINGEGGGSEADGVFAFEMQAGLRECVYLGSVAAFWRGVFSGDGLEERRWGWWVNLLDHHDEMYMGFFPPGLRRWMGEYVRTHGGCVFKNGMSGAGRLAECVNEDMRRVVGALVLLYLAPGVPMVYAGTEVGARNDWAHARREERRVEKVCERLGVFAREGAWFDGRELHRGALRRETLARECEGIRAVRVLNRLWEEGGWDRQEVEAADVEAAGVVAAIKGGVLCVVNLNAIAKTARLRLPLRLSLRPRPDAPPALAERLVDLLSASTVSVQPGPSSAEISVPLAPYASLVLDLRQSVV